jgi:hypothetical protein
VSRHPSMFALLEITSTKQKVSPDEIVQTFYFHTDSDFFYKHLQTWEVPNHAEREGDEKEIA